VAARLDHPRLAGQQAVRSVVLRCAGLVGRVDAVVSVSGPGRWYYRGTKSMRRVHWAVESRLGRLYASKMLNTRISSGRWDPVPVPPADAALLDRTPAGFGCIRQARPQTRPEGGSRWRQAQDRAAGPGQSSSAISRGARLGWLKGLLALVIAFFVVEVAVNPWTFHIGDRFTPLMTWDGYGTVQASNGGHYLLFTQLQGAVTEGTLWVGVVKAPFFAAIIALVGCYEGLNVTRSAESVGRLTTQSVVESIFFVIVTDAAFSIMFSILKI